MDSQFIIYRDTVCECVNLCEINVDENKKKMLLATISTVTVSKTLFTGQKDKRIICIIS